MKPWIGDVSLYLARANAARRPILFEGAQGTLLDIDHGSYPYVTSSNSTIGGVCTGLGVSPKMIDGVLGMVKAYSTRVGEGPMPTGAAGKEGDHLATAARSSDRSPDGPPMWVVRRRGGAVRRAHQRPRQRGAHQAGRAGRPARDPRVHRLSPGKDELTEWPADLNVLAACQPIYKMLPGWSRPTVGVTKFEQLPAEAQRYVGFLEEITGVPVSIVSTGTGRQDTIIRDHSRRRGMVRRNATKELEN
jgi:adenylosuccinate synthase